MRYLFFLTIAVLLGATLSARVPADVSVNAAPAEPVVAVSETVDLAASVISVADRPTCFGRRATLVGTSGDDEIIGTSQTDVIVARAGNDVVRSRGNRDFVCGGHGDDRLNGGANASGGFGDNISGDEGNDRILSDGKASNDVLRGGPGDDHLTTPTQPASYTDFVGPRVLRGGPGADTVVGSADDAVYGGPGPDRLTATGAFAGALQGGPGADVVTTAKRGDTGIDLLADGDQILIRAQQPGFTVSLFAPHVPVPIEVDLAAGTIRRVGAATGDVITHLTPGPTLVRVTGTFYNDRISGTDNGEILNGNFGNDILAGRGGDDFLDGFFGRDVLDGGDGHDVVDGGDGRDTCVNAEKVTDCSP
jgi:Ca2+-binding RTX toxin-like protein